MRWSAAGERSITRSRASQTDVEQANERKRHEARPRVRLHVDQVSLDADDAHGIRACKPGPLIAHPATTQPAPQVRRSTASSAKLRPRPSIRASTVIATTSIRITQASCPWAYPHTRRSRSRDTLRSSTEAAHSPFDAPPWCAPPRSRSTNAWIGLVARDDIELAPTAIAPVGIKKGAGLPPRAPAGRYIRPRH